MSRKMKVSCRYMWLYLPPHRSLFLVVIPAVVSLSSQYHNIQEILQDEQNGRPCTPGGASDFRPRWLCPTPRLAVLMASFSLLTREDVDGVFIMEVGDILAELRCVHSGGFFLPAAELRAGL